MLAVFRGGAGIHRYGNRTIDDRGFSWINWYCLTDDEYKQMVADRAKAKPKSTASLQ